MFYIPDSLLDQWILDDVNLGDLTTRAMGIGSRPGTMTFALRGGGRVSGVTACVKLLRKLDLEITDAVEDGQEVAPGATLLTAFGPAAALHQGWKVAQNILEWSCGVAGYVAAMLAAAREHSRDLHVACTRKTVPGTKLLANAAVTHGGGIVHRAGTAETILLFANHRVFFDCPDDWAGHVARLRAEAPEKTLIVEADTPEQVEPILRARPDVVQLDKFSPAQVRDALDLARTLAPGCLVSAAGGIHLDNIADYARTGVRLVVTSAPYAAKSADVKVALAPLVVS